MGNSMRQRTIFAIVTVLGATIFVGVGAILYWSDPPRFPDEKPAEVPAPRLPEQKLFGGYVSASACRSCHPGQHASWHDSYHRTMTQRVTAESMVAPLGEALLTSRGRTYKFTEEDGRFFVEMADPEQDLTAQRMGWPTPSGERLIRRQIVMSTGSHHYQTYWINGSRGNQLWQVPWIFHLKDQRWIPAEDAFIAPPGNYRRITDWNDNCVQCHAVGGRPRFDEAAGEYRTQVVDLGIACEACHGPGENHVRYHNSQSDVQTLVKDDIINPARLDSVRASEVCGQCHSSNGADPEEFLESGHRYRPGDDLTQSRTVHRYEDDAVQSRNSLRDGFWGDGTIRLAGREYNGLQLSACFLKGNVSCLSCHSMHGYESTDDQLAPGLRSDKACLQCHDAYAENITAHTHHPPDSPGSRCFNCHMPYTSFGLFKAVRSHRIDSPSAAATIRHGRPNACNLCHADQPVSWTASYLTRWYDQPPVSSSPFAQEHAASVLFLLSGDAAQRAVVAWNFGRDEVRAATSSDWQAPLLAELLVDPYSVVRYVASQSLRRYPGMESLDYDFLAPEPDREQARQEALKLWSKTTPRDFPSQRSCVLIGPDGLPDRARLEMLRKLRDDRPVVLPE